MTSWYALLYVEASGFWYYFAASPNTWNSVRPI
jgi:hypothetical protein